MNQDTTAACPRIEDISALVDGELTVPAASQLRAHIAQCPLCTPVLSRFTAMGTQLRTLRETSCDVDLAAIVLPQLPPRAPVPAKNRQRRGWGGLWQLAPGGLAGAGALAAGAYLGLMLVAGGGGALRPAAITVFDAVPPGAVCAGLPACSPGRR